MNATAIQSAFEIRVTRNRFYGQPGDNGDSILGDLEGRNGHYVTGDTMGGAILNALDRFPGESITLQYWRENGKSSERRGELVGKPWFPGPYLG